MAVPYIPRTLQLSELLARKSYFLLGPRQTGKTSLVRHSLPKARRYDLLDTSVYLTLSRHPERLVEEIQRKDRWIVIDEIQRMPHLLNEVQRLIEEKGIHFLLTGSSARKLRQGGVNLLGGRARFAHLHPLTSEELGDRYDLARAAHRGLLPSIYFSDDPDADLEAYAGAYLQQEIVAEAATRNVPAFSRFLKVAAHCNGTIVNFTNVANDAQVPRTTVYEYFNILIDTLVVRALAPWKQRTRRKPIVSPKYYFFDVGVVRALQNREFRMGTPEFGEAMETLLMHELTAYGDYRGRPKEGLSYWRSTSGYEVDFILEDHTAIEVKAKRNLSGHDLRSLKALSEESKFKRLLCVCLEDRPRKEGAIEIMPVRQFLQALWYGAFRG